MLIRQGFVPKRYGINFEKGYNEVDAYIKMNNFYSLLGRESPLLLGYLTRHFSGYRMLCFALILFSFIHSYFKYSFNINAKAEQIFFFSKIGSKIWLVSVTKKNAWVAWRRVDGSFYSSFFFKYEVVIEKTQRTEKMFPFFLPFLFPKKKFSVLRIKFANKLFPECLNHFCFALHVGKRSFLFTSF